jgi:hypothetical protein
VRGKGFIKRKNTAILGIIHHQHILMKSGHRIHGIQRRKIIRIYTAQTSLKCRREIWIETKRLPWLVSRDPIYEKIFRNRAWLRLGRVGSRRM